MLLETNELVALGLLTGTTHWIVARSEIARPLWSRARGWFAKLLACPACSGFWLGLGYGAAGITPLAVGQSTFDIVAAGVLGVFTAPVAQAILLWALSVTALPTDDTEATSPPPEASIDDV